MAEFTKMNGYEVCDAQARKELKNKVNKNIQDSILSRVFRMFEDSYNMLDAISYLEGNIYLSISNGISSKIIKLNSNFNVITSKNVDYLITSISVFGNQIIVSDNTYTLRKLNLTTLEIEESIVLTQPINKIKKYNDIYYVLSNSEFFTTTDFTTFETLNFTKNCIDFNILNDYLYILYENTIEVYNLSDLSLYRIQNLETIVNNGFVRGLPKAIYNIGSDTFIGTYKKLIPIREDYCFSIYRMNNTTNVNQILEVLNYNSTRNEFAIYYDSSNLSTNPTGTETNPFNNIYEAFEVAINSNYSKGNITFLKENEVIEDLFISDLYKKCGLYFNNATIKGMLIRNSNKIEMNDVNIQDEYLQEGTPLLVVNADIVLTETVNITDTKTLGNLMSARYGSNVCLLCSLTGAKLISQTGSKISTRNNSYYDPKEVKDRFSKFSPNVVLLSDEHKEAGNTYEFDSNLNIFTNIELRVNFQGELSHHIIPAINGEYSLTTSLYRNDKFYVGNMFITVEDNKVTLTREVVYNLTEGMIVDSAYTHRINGIYGRC